MSLSRAINKLSLINEFIIDIIDKSMPFSPSLRLIISATKTPSYKLAKYLVLLLTPLTSHYYIIKNSFSFAEEVSSFDCAHYMTSFDNDSLFTNIPLE